MSNVIDARGLACPEPLLLTKKALSASDLISVLVDNEVAKDNILRYSKNQGFSANSTIHGEDYLLEIKKNG